MAELKMGGEGLPLNLQQVVAATSNSSSKPKKTGRPRISSVEELREREEPKWTVFSASQNLSAALNDPARRELDLFTKTWGGYFTPTAPLPPSNIPNIELGDFLRYLKETAAVSARNLWDAKTTVHGEVPMHDNQWTPSHCVVVYNHGMGTTSLIPTMEGESLGMRLGNHRQAFDLQL